MVSSLQVMLDCEPRSEWPRCLTGPITDFYGGPLCLPEGAPSRLVGNFVTSLDGVTSFRRDDARGAAAVGGGSPEDRLLMALLRAAADAILIGAGTLRVTRNHRWTPQGLLPALSDQLTTLRSAATGSDRPAPLVVVSATGDIPGDHPALRIAGGRPLVITTAAGRRRLPALPAPARVRVGAPSGRIPAGRIMAILGEELAPRLVLTEGGAELFGSLLAARLVNELFLTVNPMIAGRGSGTSRPGLVEGYAAPPARAPRASLLSLRRAESGHLFFRYGFPGAAETTAG